MVLCDAGMDEQSGRRLSTRTGDRFGAAFTCPPELRAAFESLTGELVDYRLAHYSQSRLRPHAGRDSGDGTAPAASFRAKVSHTGGKPILFVPPVEDEPARPTGPTRVRLPDGSEWVFRLVKVACNVAHKSDAAEGTRATAKNDLPALLRDWFGPDAGLPGTGFEVEFTRKIGRRARIVGRRCVPGNQATPSTTSVATTARTALCRRQIPDRLFAQYGR